MLPNLLLLALLLDPQPGDREQAEIHLQRGNEAFRASRVDEAIREYQLAHRLYPRDSLFFNLAQAYEEAGRKREALESFNRYLSASQRASRQEAEPYAPERVAYARERAEALHAELASIVAPAQAAAASTGVPALPRPRKPEAPPSNLNDLQLTQTPPSGLKSGRLKWWLVALGAVAAGTVTTILILRSRDEPGGCKGTYDLGCL